MISLRDVAVSDDVSQLGTLYFIIYLNIAHHIWLKLAEYFQCLLPFSSLVAH